MLDITAAEIRVVLLNARGNVVQRESILVEKSRIGHDLELPRLSAPRIDFTYARNGSQLTLDHPFVQVLEFHRAHGPRERVLVEFAEGGGRQSQHRLDTAWEQRR